MAIITPRVIDISHHNVGPLKGGQIDFEAAAKAGIWGVICKASEGTGYGDPTYDARRPLIKAAGLVHGAYHFNTGEDTRTQVERFLAQAEPSNTTCMVLDFERQTNLKLGNMTIQQACEFLHLIDDALGRKAKIYSGDRLKENIGQLGPLDRAFLLEHDLWLAQYGATAELPAGYAKYWLWQFTGDGFGEMPHSIAGINGKGCDLNAFGGDCDALVASWVA